MKTLGIFTFVCICIPIIVYFSVKFGTVAFYNAKKLIEKKNQSINVKGDLRNVKKEA
jgi:hypothetical protein